MKSNHAPGICAETMRSLRGTRGATALYMVVHQRKWIEWCESNGMSYAGNNGVAIRNADRNELRAWEFRCECEIGPLFLILFHEGTNDDDSCP
jgi:hypothetical protein